MGARGNGYNQWELERNGNKTRLNLGVGMGMGTDKWEWEGIRILIVFPHTSIILTVSNELISYT